MSQNRGVKRTGKNIDTIVMPEYKTSQKCSRTDTSSSASPEDLMSMADSEAPGPAAAAVATDALAIVNKMKPGSIQTLCKSIQKHVLSGVHSQIELGGDTLSVVFQFLHPGDLSSVSIVCKLYVPFHLCLSVCVCVCVCVYVCVCVCMCVCITLFSLTTIRLSTYTTAPLSSPLLPSLSLSPPTSLLPDQVA
jgi:hypothetical protein